MYEELNTVLSAELVSLSPKQKFFLSLLLLFVIPSIRVTIFKFLPSSSIKHLFLFPAAQVFVVEFLFRSPSISVSHVLVTFLVLAAVILNITYFNYILFHQRVLREYGNQSNEIESFELAWECSFPVNVVQQVGTNLVMVLICRHLGYSGLSISRTILLGFVSIWTERVCIQLVWYFGSPPEKNPYRVFFTHWGSCADKGHWLLQLEDCRYHIMKRHGSSTADLSPAPRSEQAHAPPPQESLYIPFCQYGIVGLSDRHTLGQWEDFIQKCIQPGGYNVSNQSCQEYVIFNMYYLCYPPLFNMSDTKSLGPIILVVFLSYAPLLYRLLFQI
ncbi:uncharacterized protein K444DRAFT_608998 [Hyaloscypha bicolor E]|uniref:Uncharacterized protein n=1 Tax=Hyaloscypha bicolor E TaxID=1095630 RepID=A0A2J6TNC3_9HELO|nr:uncharacterized protein K444DRAFT_608998 [Hyaloscypha bicolor E]PMD64517.1 hypothetical protein K444DRAFT_608998 [Hyaloscypha bicolor E]